MPSCAKVLFLFSGAKARSKPPGGYSIAGLSSASSVQRAWTVLTVTLNFDFLFIISIRTVIAAIRLKGWHLTLALRIHALVLATHVHNFCHEAPRFSKFADRYQGAQPPHGARTLAPDRLPGSSYHALLFTSLPSRCCVGRYVAGSCSTERTCSNCTSWERETIPCKVPSATTGS